MRPEFESYFDHRWLCRPWGGNSILFTAEYTVLAANSMTGDKLPRSHAEIAIDAFIKTAIDELPSGESFSHDDMSAIVCLSHFYRFDYHTNLKLHKIDWIHRLHPRDIIFYMWALGGIYQCIAFFLLPILTICMIESVWHLQYKTINERAVLATDGALLTWLRINTFSFPITKFLVEKAMRSNGMKWSDYFATYFGREHPCYILAKDKGI